MYKQIHYTKIVSAFPGCGKSYIFTNYNDKYYNGIKYKFLDSDSSNFSWIETEHGKERNPNFPDNYIEHIKNNIGKVDVIFVSSHKEVREALLDAKIPFYMVYPDITLKPNFLELYKNRGNTDKFIDFVSSNWENFIYDIMNTHSIYITHKKLTILEPHISMDWIYDILH